MAAQPSVSASSSTPAATGSSAAGPESNDVDATGAGSTSLPVRDKESFKKLQLERFLTRDWLHSSLLSQSATDVKESTTKTLAKIDEYRRVKTDLLHHAYPPGVVYGEGYRGYGNGFTERPGPPVIMYPETKPRPGKRTTPPLRWKRKDALKQAEQHEELVPIRIDVDWDKIKLRDTFTWNLHERLVRPELFAAQIVEDMGIKQPAAEPVHQQIYQQLMEQLNDFYPFAYSEEDALDPELPYSAYKNDEMRILIKLNITIGQHTLIDQFEWEINNPSNSPEEFAASMARDLALSGEFTTSIAHCIREQCQLFTRSLYSVGHPFDGRPIEDADLVMAFLPSPLPTVFRPQQQAKEYAPYLYELNEADLERNEMIFSREQRRQKRSVNRRGGPQLPDLKERARTIRTLIVSSVLPGAALEVDASRLYKKAVGVPGGRKRAGARDGDLSDSEEDEDSAPDSPAMANNMANAGTARTRGMRGAASAAQQRMANLGRSETPEAAAHHHETRISARRLGRDPREGTEEPGSLIVHLRVSGHRLRELFRDMREGRTRPPRGVAAAASTPTPGPPTPGMLSRTTSHSATPVPHPTLAGPATLATPSSSMPPPTSNPSSLSGANKQPGKPAAAAASNAQLGGLPADPPENGVPPPLPPPPEWLAAALVELNKQYPDDSFEGLMKYAAVNVDTGKPVVPAPPLPLPDDVQYMHLPRIRCLDCPGKLYTPGPDTTVGNFEVHLKNKQHLENVRKRLNASRPSSGAG